jgi:glutathione S-transferase
MRARLAIYNSKINVELREVVLKDKPKALLSVSPKATVPVLQLANGNIIEESIEIMYWALQENDPDEWLPSALLAPTQALIQQNDDEFKYWLDRYKYADRYLEHPVEFYRTHCESWFAMLEQKLIINDGYLLLDRYTLADFALFPFVRQCAHVDRSWFLQTPYIHLQAWLEKMINSSLFAQVMQKRPQWKEEIASL